MTNKNNDRDLFDELGAANPFMDEGTNPQPMTSSEARFEEITMQPHETHTAPRKNPSAAPSPWWRRPMVAAPTAIALVAILAVGALIASTLNAPSALAQVTAAAQLSAQFESGRTDIAIEFREADQTGESFIALVHRYEGNNFEFTQELDLSDPNGRFVLRQVDGTVYSQIPGFTGDGNWVAQPEEADELWDQLGISVNPETISPDSVIGLIELSDDFDEVDSDDGVTTFRGSVPSSVVIGMSPDELPPGLSLLASSDGNDDLPETLTISIDVRDDALETIVVDIVGDTPEGFADATMTATFSELGEPQNLVAPSADEIVDAADLAFDVPEELEGALEVMEELEERRPELCNEVFTDLPDPADSDFADIDIDEEMAQMAELTESFAQCLEDEGEPAAAEAFRSMMIDFSS